MPMKEVSGKRYACQETTNQPGKAFNEAEGEQSTQFSARCSANKGLSDMDVGNGVVEQGAKNQPMS